MTTQTAPLWLLALLGCLAAHALADGLQGGLSRAKRRVGRDGVAKPRLSQWLPSLALHGFWHGLGVALALGDPALGLAEWAAHAAIDFGKCERRYSSAADQLLHLACKGVWLALWLGRGGALWWARG